MKGLLLTNAYYSTQATVYQEKRLAEEGKIRGVQIDVRRNDFFPAYLDGDSIKNCVEGYDFCIFLDKDKYMSELLKSVGLRLFNTHEAIRACDDKMETYIALVDKGIRIPKTIPGLLCYNSQEVVKEESAERIEQILTYPIIIKESYGALGKTVYKADDRERLLAVMDKVKDKSHFYQEYIASSFGRDVRVTVIGGKAVASMLRTAQNGDFRSNIELGGQGKPFELNDDFRRISEAAASILGLDYCGVDLLFGEDGKPYLCEVNSNAFFGGTESVTGVNVAGLYIEHIISTLTQGSKA